MYTHEPDAAQSAKIGILWRCIKIPLSGARGTLGRSYDGWPKRPMGRRSKCRCDKSNNWSYLPLMAVCRRGQQQADGVRRDSLGAIQESQAVSVESKGRRGQSGRGKPLHPRAHVGDVRIGQ